MNRSRTGAGFTLVEMLVVIGVIGILAGLLVPVLNNAREVARETRCIANLKAMGTGVVLYVQAYDNYLPACGPSSDDTLGTYKVWYRALLPYTENWLVYACPTKYPSTLDIPDVVEKKKQPSNMKWHEVHYGMNYTFMGVDKNTALVGRTIQMDELNNPARILYIADGGLFKAGSSGSSDKLDPKLEDPISVRDGGIVFPMDDGKLPADKPTISPRHRGSTMCLFLDGHVEKLETMKILSVKRDDPNCLYAVPPPTPVK